MHRLLAAFAGTVLGIVSLDSGYSRSDKDKTEPAPKPIAEFSLSDVGGKIVSFSGLKEHKAVVVIFIGTQCPINNAYMPRLCELHKELSAKGVAMLAINPVPQDTAEEVAAHAKKHGLTFPVLKDADQAVVRQFGAQRTPEVFVLDNDRVIRYQGRIDDQFGVGYTRPKPTRNDLAEAVEAVLFGKPITQPKTEVAGCLITIAKPSKTVGTVTYSKHIASIMQDKCQECHRPGQIGPMPLMTYEDVADWSAMIREVVDSRRMPPWHADPRHGKFENNRSLTPADRETLLKWIDQGCAEGDKLELPRPRDFADGWRIGKPDAVFTMPHDFTVPAKAPPRGIPYQYFMVKTNFDEDKWIQAAEAAPGNRAVVHHVIVYASEPNQMPKNHEDRIGNGFLVGEAPGDTPAVFPPGVAKKLPKGGVLMFQMHYTPNGTEQNDRTSVGLVFAKEPPKLEMRTRAISARGFVIPPGDSNHRVVTQSTFRADAIVYSLMPHMHLRGKDFRYEVVFPDGSRETLLSVPRWDFNWQSNYRFEKPLRLPAGSRIECTAHYDNSANNLSNPDPTKTVRWGDQTWQEMMIGFVDYAYLNQPAG